GGRSRDGFHGGGDVGVNLGGGIDRPSDPERRRLALRRRQERLLGLGPVRITGQVPTHRAESERNVSHGSGDDAAGGQSGPVFTEQRTAGDPAARRLQSDNAATRRRDPDRSTAVAPVSKAAEPGGDGRRGATAGAARRPGPVNRVARRREHRTFGYRAGPKLRCVRLSQDDSPLLLQAPDGEAVDLGN